MRNTLAIFAYLTVLGACGSTQPQITNYQAKGNLSHSQQMGCESVDKLSSQNNPVDIFDGVYQCIDIGNYVQAAELYFAAMTYAYFDTKRVSDSTSHQAISVLRMNTFGSMSEQQIDALQTALSGINTESLCLSLQKLGPPSYKPTYMIQHGMGAFLGQGSNGGIVANFDSSKAWEDSLATIAKCPIGD